MALAAALAQLAAGEEAPYVAPDSLLPYGTDYCAELWQVVTGHCNPCITLAAIVAMLVPQSDLVCPE